MPVFSDEDVFHTVADIVTAEPTQFDDLFPMLGMFHYTKFLLRCAGRYLLGSGVDDVLIENEVFGKKVLHSVGSSFSTKPTMCANYKDCALCLTFEALRYLASSIQQQFEDWKKMRKKIWAMSILWYI